MSTGQDTPETIEESSLENQIDSASAAAEVPIVAETAQETTGEEVNANVSISHLQDQLALAHDKARENWEKMLRVQAEMENLKRRTQKDLDDTRKYAIERFAKELITVVDSLELGLQAITGDSPDVQKFREGNELTLKQFEAAFAKVNIETVNPLNQPFNPEHHQAMTMQPSAEVAPNTVLTVFQKGYLLNGRLLRPAMVVVAKAAE